ncbi:MAG: TrkA family potassium uptake protein [Deferrisomatales bacterium]
MERRRFAVIGLGKFGHHLARYLYDLGQDVLAIDRDPEAVEAIRPYCSRAQVADAADKEELAAAGLDTAEVGVVGLGTQMDVSILATLFLKEMGVKEITAKAVSLDHARILERIGATEVIHPERDVAIQLARHLAEPDILEHLPFLEGYALVELRVPRALWGKTLAQTRLRQQHRLSAVLIRRTEGDTELSIPAGPDEPLRAGDTLLVLAKKEDVDRFRAAHPE